MANRKKIPTFEFNTYADLYSHVSSSKIEVLSTIADSINYAIDKKKSVAIPFAVKHEKDQAILELGINESQFKPMLQQIYSYMLNNEKYEYVGKVVKIQNKLKADVKPVRVLMI